MTPRERPRGELVVLAIALILPSLATYAYFILLGGQPLMRLAYGISKTMQFSLPIVWILLVCQQRISFKSAGLQGMSGGLLFGLATGGAILGIYYGFLKNSVAFIPMSAAIREKVSGMGALTPVSFVILGAFISIIHSFLEEYYWRWFVFAQLQMITGLVSAILISSLGFMAHHVLVVGVYLNWQHWPLLAFFSLSVAAGGAFWAWLYHKTGNLLAPWISHLVVDCSIMIIGYDQLWGF